MYTQDTSKMIRDMVRARCTFRREATCWRANLRMTLHACILIKYSRKSCSLRRKKDQRKMLKEKAAKKWFRKILSLQKKKRPNMVTWRSTMSIKRRLREKFSVRLPLICKLCIKAPTSKIPILLKKTKQPKRRRKRRQKEREMKSLRSLKNLNHAWSNRTLLRWKMSMGVSFS